MSGSRLALVLKNCSFLRGMCKNKIKTSVILLPRKPRKNLTLKLLRWRCFSFSFFIFAHIIIITLLQHSFHLTVISNANAIMRLCFLCCSRSLTKQGGTSNSLKISKLNHNTFSFVKCRHNLIPPIWYIFIKNGKWQTFCRRPVTASSLRSRCLTICCINYAKFNDLQHHFITELHAAVASLPFPLAPDVIYSAHYTLIIETEPHEWLV